MFKNKKLVQENQALKQQLAALQLQYNSDIESLNAQLQTCKSHSECRLGQWYYHGDGQSFRHLPSYSLIEATHQQVHESGRNAMTKAQKGDMQQMVASNQCDGIGQ